MTAGRGIRTALATAWHAGDPAHGWTGYAPAGRALTARERRRCGRVRRLLRIGTALRAGRG